jgi:5'-deoxynucleotidase YfbR-like HD superfamily hydrolase
MPESNLFDSLLRARRLYDEKQVYRKNHVGKRHECDAEHSWSCVVLCDFFEKTLGKELKLDFGRVRELVTYHDAAEIITGDKFVLHKTDMAYELMIESKAAVQLKKEFASSYGDFVYSCLKEFHSQKTKEAEFAKAIDKLDVILTCLESDSKDWRGWTEAMVRKTHGEAIVKFPQLIPVFEGLLVIAKKKKLLTA